MPICIISTFVFFLKVGIFQYCCIHLAESVVLINFPVQECLVWYYNRWQEYGPQSGMLVYVAVLWKMCIPFDVSLIIMYYYSSLIRIKMYLFHVKHVTFFFFFCDLFCQIFAYRYPQARTIFHWFINL